MFLFIVRAFHGELRGKAVLHFEKQQPYCQSMCRRLTGMYAVDVFCIHFLCARAILPYNNNKSS